MSIMSKITAPNSKKAHVYRMTAAVAALYVLSLLLGYIYSSVSNNIVFMSSALMYVLEIGLSLLDIALFAVAFSYFVFAAQRYGLRKSTPFFVSYASLTAARRVLSLVLELLLSGSVGADDFASIGIYFGLDMATGAIVVAIVAYECKKYNEYVKEWQKVHRNLGQDPEPPALYPFETIFSRKNPLQVCAIKIGLLLSGAKILSRIIFDLYLGAPTSLSAALIMAIYYLSDVLIGVIVYAAMLGLFGLLYKKKDPQEIQE